MKRLKTSQIKRSDATLAPQPGPQEAFLSTPADIAIYGGSAGSGKTYGLLLEVLRNVSIKNFGAVIFRREATQITNEGGLWDTAMNVFPLANGKPFVSPVRRFFFPGGGKIIFSHLHSEKSVLGWQGGQVALIGFDELTHFLKSQFFYMLSRNRSLCGVKPYIRATTNPDSESWVAKFISWWIDQDSGFPIPERSGVLRWFVRISDEIHWAKSPGELSKQFGIPVSDAKSVTFIPAKITDNPLLMLKDPMYMANLRALGRVERGRLLEGNWKIRPAAGMYFPRADAKILDVAPGVVKQVRSWDLAATESTESNPNPSATAGVKMGRHSNGRFVILHMVHIRKAAHDVREAIKNTAEQDTRQVPITLPQDPGQAGKGQAQSFALMLSGWPVKLIRPTGDKVTRAEPFAAQWQAGNVDIVRASWNETLLDELDSFPDGGNDDIVDACSDAFAELEFYSPIEFQSTGKRRVYSR